MYLKLKNINDIFIGQLYQLYEDEEMQLYIYYKNNNKIFIYEHDKNLLDNYINDNLTINKLKGCIIYKELLQKILHPNNILHIIL